MYTSPAATHTPTTRSVASVRTLITVGRRLGIEVYRAYVSIAGDVHTSIHLSDAAARTWIADQIKRAARAA